MRDGVRNNRHPGRKPRPRQARAIAEEAYVFGFAIVEYNKAIWAYGVEPKSPRYAGFNTIRSESRLYGPEDTSRNSLRHRQRGDVLGHGRHRVEHRFCHGGDSA